MLQAIPENFYGKYKLATSENFDNFLKEIGKSDYYHFLRIFFF